MTRKGPSQPNAEVSPRKTLLTYRLPMLPATTIAMRMVLFDQSVRDFLQLNGLAPWEAKELVIKHANLPVLEEGNLGLHLVTQARQIQVEKGVRLRDIAAYHAGLKSPESDWADDPVSTPAEVDVGKDATDEAPRSESGGSMWHPPRTALVISPTYMRTERNFYALDRWLGVPIDHDRFVEFNEAGDLTRDVPGSMIQIPMLVVAFPETFTLRELCREIRLQLRRKLALLAQQGNVVLPASELIVSPYIPDPEDVRDELFDHGVSTLVVLGFAKRHVKLADNRYAPGIWNFLRHLVRDGIDLWVQGTPALIDMLKYDDVWQLFPQGVHSISTLRLDEVATYMSYYWGVIGIDAPMPDEFVQLAAVGAYQRGLIEHLCLDFNRRVNGRNEEWRTALQASSNALTGDMKRLRNLLACAIDGTAIALSDALRYQDELPLGFKIKATRTGGKKS